MQALLDRWQPSSLEEIEFSIESVEHLTAVISSLANEHHTDLHLFHNDLWYAINADDGRYTAGLFIEERELSFMLVDDAMAEGRELIVIGSQQVDADNRYIHRGLHKVLRAAVELYQTGTMDTTGANWKMSS